MDKEKLLVTGGKGFIASAYIREMELCGYECIIYDLPENDILDRIGLRLAIEKADIVVHFAAIADVGICIVEQDKTFDVNVRGTYNIASLCAEYDKKLIFISTCCVYGNSLDRLEDEYTTNYQCKEPYAVSKVAGEAIIKGVPNLQYVIVRVGTVHGEGARNALFTSICLNHLMDDEIIYLDGQGSQQRQLIYIDDLILGIKKITYKFDEVKSEIFNLCGKEKISAIDCIEVAEKVTGIKATIMTREQRYGQTYRENISIANAKDRLDWIPQISFEEGMKSAWMNDPRWKDCTIK